MGSIVDLALIRDWGRLRKAYTLERLHRGQRKCRWRRQIFSTQSWDWLAVSKLTASSRSHSPLCNCLAALGPICFCFTVPCSGLFGAYRRTQTHPSGSPYFILGLCTLCLLQALELFVCLVPTWSSRSPAPNSAKVKYWPKPLSTSSSHQEEGRYMSPSLLMQSPKPGEEFGATLTSKDV